MAMEEARRIVALEERIRRLEEALRDETDRLSRRIAAAKKPEKVAA
jgi:hypothetical protein